MILTSSLAALVMMMMTISIMMKMITIAIVLMVAFDIPISLRSRTCPQKDDLLLKINQVKTKN